MLQACDKFYYCSDGIPNEHPCPPGLIFDEESSNCDWKESVNRQCDHLTKGMDIIFKSSFLVDLYFFPFEFKSNNFFI